MESFVVIKEFLLPRKGVGTNVEEISLWFAYHATPVRALGLSSFMAQAPKVNVYIICLLRPMSILSRMLINKTIIICRTKGYLGTVKVKTILAIQAFLGLLEESFQVRSR